MMDVLKDDPVTTCVNAYFDCLRESNIQPVQEPAESSKPTHIHNWEKHRCGCRRRRLGQAVSIRRVSYELVASEFWHPAFKDAKTFLAQLLANIQTRPSVPPAVVSCAPAATFRSLRSASMTSSPANPNTRLGWILAAAAGAVIFAAFAVWGGIPAEAHAAIFWLQAGLFLLVICALRADALASAHSSPWRPSCANRQSTACRLTRARRCRFCSSAAASRFSSAAYGMNSGTAAMAYPSAKTCSGARIC